jgi:predicted methyltransferase
VRFSLKEICMARGFCAVLMSVALTACAQGEVAKSDSTTPAPARAEAADLAKFPAPDRAVADIITNHSGPEPERDATNEAGQTMDLLPLKPGVTVADIGAGEGYFTVRLARRLGTNGQVIATDVTPDYLEDLKARVATEKLSNVSFVRGGFDDPNLPPASVDVALMVRMYHEIEQPYAFLWRLHDALKPGGVIAISERDKATENHGTPPGLLRCELAAVGYRQIGFKDLGGESGYVALFAPVLPRPEPQEIVACTDDD